MSEKKGIEFFKSKYPLIEVLQEEESHPFWQGCALKPIKM